MSGARSVGDTPARVSDQSTTRGPGQVEPDKELKYRLSLLTPEDTIRGLMLNSVLRVVRELGGAELAHQCLDVVGEKKFVDFFLYPSRLHLELLYTAAGLLEARHGGFEKTLWIIGYQGVKNFFASTPGKLMLLGRGDIHRLLKALPSAFSVAGGMLKSEVVVTSPWSAVFVLHRDFIHPAYTEGTLQSVLEFGHVKGLRVKWRPSATLVSEYELAWE